MNLFTSVRQLRRNARRRHSSRANPARRFTVEGLEARALLTQMLYLVDGSLYVDGDQLGSNYNDSISLDLNGSGGQLVTLNGEQFSYSYGEVNHVYVYTEGGSNDVYVNNTSSESPVTIYGGGADEDFIGNSHEGVQGINGPVDVHNSPSYTELFIDDTADDFSSRTATVDQNGVYGLAPATITYTQADLSELAINTGSVGDSIVVDDTPDNGQGLTTYINNFSGRGSNDIDVYGTASQLDLDGGAGSQSVDVGDGYLGDIYGAVDVFNTNPYGSSYLRIDDSSDIAGQTAHFYDGELTGLGSPTPIYWSPWSSATGGVIYLDVYGGSGGNTFDVNNTSDFDYTYISAGSGSNSVDVYDTTGTLYVDGGSGFDDVDVGLGSLAGIDGLVDVYDSSSSGSSYLYIDDGADTTGRTANLHDGELTGLNSPAPIEWSPSSSSTGGVTYVAAYGGSGNDTFNVSDTSDFYYYTYISTGNGTNTVNITATTGELIIAGSGTDSLVGPNITNTWDIAGTGSGNVGNVDFSGVSKLTGGSGNDTFNFGGGGSVSAVNGGGGANTLIGPDATNTWSITNTNAGNVAGITFSNIENLTGGTGADTFKFGNGKGVTGKINGAGGSDTLNYSACTAGVAVNIATGTATGTGGVSAIENVTGSPTSDTLTGNSSANVISGDGGTDTLSGGGGGDTFILGSSQGSSTKVTDTGTGNTLDAANVANTWTLTGANAGNVNGITYTGIQNLVGGTSTDAFKFNAAGSVSGTVNGGNGSNTLDYSSHGTAAITVNLQTHTATGTAGFSNIAALVGGGGTTDTLVGANATNTWNITGSNAGNVNGTFTFSAIENLAGGTSMDIFKFGNGVGVTGSINGGGGTGWLDYASYTTAVTVNLATGAARGVGGKVTNVHNVRGGSGGNMLTGDSAGGILIGGAGADTITGGGGRSILIGDKGVDKVKGGSNDDIVIGGYTNYDGSSTANDQALEAILGEWQSSDGYATRISKIKAGIGGAKFVWGTTVHDDSAANALTGGAGMDWFFQGAHDTITDKQSGEQVN